MENLYFAQLCPSIVNTTKQYESLNYENKEELMNKCEKKMQKQWLTFWTWHYQQGIGILLTSVQESERNNTVYS